MSIPVFGDVKDTSLPSVFTKWANDAGDIMTDFPVKTNGSGNVWIVYENMGSKWKTRLAYQVRKRIAATANWDGTEEWTEWADANGNVGEWTKLWNPSATAGSAAAFTSLTYKTFENGFKSPVYSIPFTFAYSVSSYDAIEYRFMGVIANYNSSKQKYYYSEPTTVVRRIDYLPAFTVDAIYDVATHRLGFFLTLTNWNRGAKQYQIISARVGNVQKNIGGFFDSGCVLSVEDSAKLMAAGSSITVSAIPQAEGTELLSSYYESKYGDRLASVLTPYEATAIITVTADTQTVPVPVLTLSTVNDLVHLSSTSDDDYTRVLVVASWDGGAETIELMPEGGAWVGDFAAPFGLPVTYRATAYVDVGANEFNRSTEAAYTLPNVGKFAFSSGEGVVYFDIESQETISDTTNSSIIELADGSFVSRHGKGAERTLSFEGQIMASRHGYTTVWLPEINLLRAETDWIYRTPYGERMKVCIKTVNRQPVDVWDVLRISIQATEVK